MSELEATQDPQIFIEARGEDWIRYRRTTDGRRWEVHGRCRKLGYCVVGAVIDGREVRTLKEAKAIMRTHYFPLDDPVTPEFTGCCPFRYVELEPLR